MTHFNTAGSTIPQPRISSHPVCEQTRHPFPSQITHWISTSALGQVKGKKLGRNRTFVSFPNTSWMTEFSVAAECGFDTIERIFDELSNPIFNEKQKISSVSKENNVKINSLCADYFMIHKLFNEPNLTKYDSPSISGVDFPSVGVKQAWHDDDKGVLTFKIIDGNRTKSNQPTKVSVSNIANPEEVEVTCDGLIFKNFSIEDDGTLLINTNVDTHLFQVKTDYYLSKEQKLASQKGISSTATSPSTHSRKKRNGAVSKLLISPTFSSCGCC